MSGSTFPSPTTPDVLRAIVAGLSCYHRYYLCCYHPRDDPATMACRTSGVVGQGKVEPDIKSNFEMLSEYNIPGASLNGKKPRELNVVQLKRWLACRGAPTSGKKPQLIER